jgi:hypothetical protein
VLVAMQLLWASFSTVICDNAKVTSLDFLQIQEIEGDNNCLKQF